VAQVITVRRLVTEVVLRSAPAVKALAAYDKLWKSVAVGAQNAAKQVNAAAASMASTVDRMASAAQATSANVRVRAGGPRAGGSGGGAGRGGADPLDAAMGRANRQVAKEAGFAAGAKSVAEATAALGRFASASDKAKAAVKDLDAQVARNRREMAELKVQAIKTGDADGTLAARMKGLSVATGEAMVKLQGARRALREVDGGLIDTIKSAAKFNVTAGSIAVTLGNLASGAVTGGLSLIKNGLMAAAKSAIDFESGMADVKKVLPSTMDAAQVKGLEEGIKAISKEVGVMPEQVAALTASLAQSGIAGEELLATADDAAKLAVAFGVSGEQAGQSLAKLRTGLGLSREEVNSLTGSINELSNNLAATAPEITAGVQGVGSIAKAANVSAKSTAALVTAMIASGAGADVAATGTKNFIASLGAGTRATKAQAESFAQLGLKATDVAAGLAKGGRDAEKTIEDVVARIGKLRQEERLPALIGLFGKESIGAIGPLATNIELLGKAFSIAGDDIAAADSVQKEYATRSATTGAAIERLKANIGVLAIELGEALLPYIQQITAFLTSPEGQEWGANAVATAKDAVVGLASAVQSLAGFFAYLIEQFGGATTAAGVFGAAIFALVGPFGAALAAGVAMGAGIAEVIDRVVNRAERAQRAMDDLRRKADDIRRAERDAEMAETHKEGDQASREIRQKKQAFDAAEAWYARESSKAGADKGALLKRRNAMESALLSGQYQPGTSFDERLAAFDGGGAASGGPPTALSPAAKLARFNDLSARRKSLKPSEMKELRKLSKELDMRIPTGGKGHKATKMDKQLAAMDPSLAGLLRAGGDEDAGGDLKVHDDVLSKAAFKAASAHGGMGGVGGVGSTGPGPSITNVDNRVMVTIQQAIDARGNAPAADNLRSAGQEVAARSGESVIRFVGANRVKALGNSGGRLTGA
jgi:TP901 family phage tail tape measure protein